MTSSETRSPRFIANDRADGGDRRPRSERTRAKQVASPFPTARPLRLPPSLYLPTPKAKPTRSKPAALVGTQVHHLRVAAGVSAVALSRRSGVSRSMLSRIENGQVSPSVETLDRLANALEVPLSRFFAEQRYRTDFSHVPSGKGLRVERFGAVADYRYELLGHVLSGNLFVEPYLVILEAEAKPQVTFQHPGLKFLYLLSGDVSYRYGPRRVKLRVGDSLLFDATALHGIEDIGTLPVSYLSVVFTLRG
jgi:transcriptional regulator with XRE-family HTH domain